MEAMTVKDLYNACARELNKGNGDKKILLSCDDEGNSFHQMFCSFTDIKGEEIEYGLPWGVTAKDFDEKYILLG